MNSSDETETLEIEGLAAGGRGVARHQGQVWFVSGAFPGDRVNATVLRRHKSYVESRLAHRLRDSPALRPSPCPLQRACGGCPWMPIHEAEQRRWKRILVQDALRRIGQTEVSVDQIRPSPVLGYRNKVELTLGRDPSGRPVVGLHPAGEGTLVDVDACLVQHDDANAVLASARGYLLEHAEDWLVSSGGRAEPYRLILRRSWLTGQILVAVRETTRPFPGAEAFAEFLVDAHPEVVGVVRIRALPGRRGGTRTTEVRGRAWLEERIGNTTFRIPAASFFQINTPGAAQLLELVVECAGSVHGRKVADLYGGVGVFGIELARGGADVTLCEADAQAIECGRHAASGAGPAKITFAREDVSSFLRSTLTADRRFDLILANPPRTGMGAGVPRLIGEHAPERVILVSCDPATLGRDTGRLARQGYVARRAIPIDLFPQTAQVETVLLLTRS